MYTNLQKRDAIQARFDMCGVPTALETHKAHATMLGVTPKQWLELAAENFAEMSLRQKARGFNTSAEYHRGMAAYLRRWDPARTVYDAGKDN